MSMMLMVFSESKEKEKEEEWRISERQEGRVWAVVERERT